MTSSIWLGITTSGSRTFKLKHEYAGETERRRGRETERRSDGALESHHAAVSPSLRLSVSLPLRVSGEFRRGARGRTAFERRARDRSGRDLGIRRRDLVPSGKDHRLIR